MEEERNLVVLFGWDDWWFDGYFGFPAMVGVVHRSSWRERGESGAATDRERKKKRGEGEKGCGGGIGSEGKNERCSGEQRGSDDVMVSIGGFPVGGSGVQRQGCWCWATEGRRGRERGEEEGDRRPARGRRRRGIRQLG
ncbi:hypothetical protein HAX54_009579 [Datura stramonium]|uniref:Uncharacterized protein n=1 Tax=Datura stramonium TaxID=4076 RepID=A0ABS8THJ3_DATST|nr:hypothetical protein [Datura stramonium]